MLFCFLLSVIKTVQCFADVQLKGPLQPVPSVAMRPEWNRFKILVWPYETDVLEDFLLYQELSLGGFQIDRGAGQDKKAVFSVQHNFPYYVGHAADKGFLYLREDNARMVTGKRDPIIRPYSLAEPKTIAKMKEHLLSNIETTKKGYVLAYAFDDEISLGRFATPCDVDVHPLSLAWFQKWLTGEYGNIGQLNAEWEISFLTFDEAVPQGFETIRKKNNKLSLASWNLAPWIDFRHFMDYQFAAVLCDLTRYTNSLDPHVPAGFVGGQGPGPWGGYDYALLSRAVQWMEAYDIHGTNEILRSWWNKHRRPRMQTFFSTKNPKLDAWFLWYYLLHGNQAVIAWPEGWFHTGEHDIAPFILANQDTFKEIQGEVSEVLVDPKTLFNPDPIGIYYSHPSIQVGWAMDAIVHGRTWINRKSSIDNKNQSKGILRKAWCKTLEDLGFQYDFVSYLDVEEGAVDLNKKFKVIIMPKTICLSNREAESLRRFVINGGNLIADYLCGVMDEHGKGRDTGVLDDLFGIIRNDSDGYLNGKGITEIDAEKYEKPFLERFTFNNGAYRHKDIVVFERGTRHKENAGGIKIKDPLGLFHRASVLVTKRSGKGRAVYCNLSPLEYWDPSKRFGDYGVEWRKIVSGILEHTGVKPRVTIYENGNKINMIESVFWRNSNKHYLGIVKNPTESRPQKTLGNNSSVQGITGQEVTIQLEFAENVSLKNLRINKNLGEGLVFHDGFKPWQGNLYEVVYY
ncbi:MAG: beta-galactosidase trimerization domain-containing protein [Thermodesulfobacteriota bacterium]|nr:beta-galactosidase trimerization domain-containing protein [Thermodesulfobacteriota bacterium]